MSEAGSERPERRLFRVRGRVQGVGFRWFCVRAARRCGVVGWVRNEPDGSVTCEAQGSRDALADLRAALARGPSFARVDRLDEAAIPPRGDEVDFEVAR